MVVVVRRLKGRRAVTTPSQQSAGDGIQPLVTVCVTDGWEQCGSALEALMITCSARSGVQTSDRSCLASTRYKIQLYFGGTNCNRFPGYRALCTEASIYFLASVMIRDVLVTPSAHIELEMRTGRLVVTVVRATRSHLLQSHCT